MEKITYKEIENANKQLIGTNVKGENYIEVNQRIKAFRIVYPNGSITTEIISLENGVVTMQATVRDDEGKILATGYAYEKENSTFINKTSFIENCETSAVGRALGMCGFGIDTSVASYEEVANAVKNQVKEEQPKANSRQDLINYCNANGLNINDIAKEYKLNAKSTENDFLNALTKLKEVN